MSEMVERVARALKGSDFDCSMWSMDALNELAKVVIAAMREPTKAMTAITEEIYRIETAGWDAEGSDVWRAMIDEALR